MRCFAQVKSRPSVKALFLGGLVAALLCLGAMPSRTSLAQAPRPTLTPTPTPTPTPGPGPAPAAQPQGFSGPNLKGRVTDLSTGAPVEDAQVIFTTASVSVEVMSNESGEYAFELGAANGVLNVVPPAGSGLRPTTANVAVRTKVGVETVVNLGVSPNGSGAPPLIPTVKVAPDWVGAGDVLTVTVTVKNTLPDAISDAIVTNWLPDSLVPVSIRSSTGNPYFSAALAVVELGQLEAGDGALVEIVAQATVGQVAATRLQGKVSFFYREDAAAQAQALGHSNGASPTVLPVTGVEFPLIGLFLVLVVVLVGWLRRYVGRTSPTG